MSTHVTRLRKALRLIRGTGRKVSASVQVRHLRDCTSRAGGDCTCIPKIHVFVADARGQVVTYHVQHDGTPRRAPPR
jgi:hypothetical protein